MDVPIDDRDLLDLGVFPLRVTSRYRHVIKKTKAHRSFFCRVVTGWTHRHESILDFTPHDQIDSLARRSSCMLRRVERTHRDDRVRVEITCAFTYDAFD